MFAHVKLGSSLVGLVCIAIGCMSGGASAVTAEVAKKCAALADKAYPPRVPGNPAAGLAEGTAQSKRDYFNKCVANGGNMDDQVPKQEKRLKDLSDSTATPWGAQAHHHTSRDAQAIFFRRRHQPSRPPPAKIRPGSPAPAMGPGTGEVSVTMKEEMMPLPQGRF